MILQLTGTSERGKPVSKCANDYVIADITLNRNLFARLFVNNCGDIELQNHKGEFVVRLNAVEFCEWKKKEEEIEM